MGNFCIACSLGEIEDGMKKIFVLSSQTPLAKILMGKGKNDSFEMNGKLFKVLKVE